MMMAIHVQTPSAGPAARSHIPLVYERKKYLPDINLFGLFTFDTSLKKTRARGNLYATSSLAGLCQLSIASCLQLQKLLTACLTIV